MKASSLLKGVIVLCWFRRVPAVRPFSKREAVVDRRSFIYLHGPDVDDPAEGFSGVPPETYTSYNATADGGPISRVLYMNTAFQNKAGLDDVTLKIKVFLTLARGMKAVPATGAPAEMLLSPVTAPWWDTYIGTSPQLIDAKEARCAPGMTRTLMTSPGERLPDDVLGAMVDPSKPLCLQLDFLIFRLGFDWGSDVHPDAKVMYDLLVKPNWAHVQLWRSHTTSSLVSAITSTMPHRGITYNVAHARRGDLASTCTSPQRVVGRMLKMDPNGVWVVVSNGERQWFSDMKELAIANGLRVVTEEDIPVMRQLVDNHLKYAVVQCLFAGGTHRVHSGKSLHPYCHPPGARDRQAFLKELGLCKQVINSNSTYTWVVDD